jgi:GntR family transcriptional regulator, transcriptional repressor for pyruvate dehydrogenase complex
VVGRFLGICLLRWNLLAALGPLEVGYQRMAIKKDMTTANKLQTHGHGFDRNVKRSEKKVGEKTSAKRLAIRDAHDAESESGPPNASPAALITPVARASVVESVTELLKREILRGALAIDSKLPAERELAVSLGVNRLTLRAALARLEALGFLTTRHGAGTRIANWRERVGLDVLAPLLAAISESPNDYAQLLASLLEVRRLILSEAVALAAERATPEDIKAIERELARRKVARLDDPIAFARADVAFMRLLARASKNVGIELILNTFARFPDEQPALVRLLYTDPSDDLYGGVLAAISSRNPDQVRVLIRGMLHAIDSEWQRRFLRSRK